MTVTWEHVSKLADVLGIASAVLSLIVLFKVSALKSEIARRASIHSARTNLVAIQKNLKSAIKRKDAPDPLLGQLRGTIAVLRKHIEKTEPTIMVAVNSLQSVLDARAFAEIEEHLADLITRLESHDDGYRWRPDQ